MKAQRKTPFPILRREKQFVEAFARTGKFVDAYLETGTKTKDRKVASLQGQRMAKRPRVREILAPLIEYDSITVEGIVEQLGIAAYAQPEQPPTWAEKLHAAKILLKHKGGLKEDSGQPAHVNIINVMPAPSQPDPIVAQSQVIEHKAPLLPDGQGREG